MHSRIAVATADGLSVGEHLARSASFVVMEVAEGKVVSRVVRHRENGPCGNHKSFVEMLEGCQGVICGGIGQGAWDALTAHGILPIVAAGKHTIDEAIGQYLAGSLATTGDKVCLCG
ncbi:MAG: NifB/NifX family molybdenum-iron cluster-binding protein [Bryobacteraceae bacterium]|jgi:predicted Fe-Mo cluster-binding NifX family protein